LIDPDGCHGLDIRLAHRQIRRSKRFDSGRLDCGKRSIGELGGEPDVEGRPGDCDESDSHQSNPR
jgi:hypothetical protein